MDSRTFTTTPEQLADLKAYLAGHSIDFVLPSGVYVGNGWNISWSLAGDDLTVNMAAHPFAEAGVFWSKVGNLLRPA